MDVFGGSCFYSSLVRIFTSDNPLVERFGINQTILSCYGSLGIGSGGGQPVFREAFIEILRLVVKALEEDQYLVVLMMALLKSLIGSL